MKNFKRIFCLSLVLVMALGLFAGCGRKKPNTKLNDGKITVGIPGNMAMPDINTNAFSVWLEEVTGLDIIWDEFASSSSSYKQQITLMAAGNEVLPEVLVGFDGMGHYVANQLGEDGVVQDIRPLIDDGKLPTFVEQLNKLPQKTRDYVLAKGTNTVDGTSFFSLPTVACETIDDQQSMIYINKKWLENVGITKLPTTIDELEQVCKAFLEKDANGNGDKDDEFPMLDVSTNTEVRDWLINAFCEYNAGCFNVDENGTVWDPYTTDEFREALKCISNFTKKGYYNELSYTYPQSETVKEIIAGRVGIFGGHMQTMTNGATTNILKDYVSLAPLADETGKGGYNIVNDVIVSWDAYITKDCYDLDEAARLLDAFYSDESVTRQRWGAKGQYWVEEPGVCWFGTETNIKVLNDKAFFDHGLNATIGNTLGIMTHANYMAHAATKDNSTDEYQIEVSRLIAEQWDNMKNKGKQQKDTLENLVYTQDEYDFRELNVGEFDSYRKEQTVKFMSGEDDINDPAKWTEYKNQVKTLKCAEIMKTIQDAYNRKVGK